MVVQVAPVEKNSGETICSLNFAQRVRAVELGQASRRVVELSSCPQVGTVASCYGTPCIGGTWACHEAAHVYCVIFPCAGFPTITYEVPSVARNKPRHTMFDVMHCTVCVLS